MPLLFLQDPQQPENEIPDRLILLLMAVAKPNPSQVSVSISTAAGNFRAG